MLQSDWIVVASVVNKRYPNHWSFKWLKMILPYIVLFGRLLQECEIRLCPFSLDTGTLFLKTPNLTNLWPLFTPHEQLMSACPRMNMISLKGNNMLIFHENILQSVLSWLLWEELPPPESLYIGSSSFDGGSVFSNVIVSHPSIQIPHVKKSAATRFQAAKSQAPKTPRTDTILPEHLLAHTLITYVYSHYCIWSFCHHFPCKN